MTDITGDGFDEANDARAPNPRVTIGDNRGPTLYDADTIEVIVRERHKATFQLAQDALDAEDRMPHDENGNLIVRDEDDEKRFSDTIKIVRAREQALDALRISEVSPYDLARDRVHAAFRKMQDALKDPDKKTQGSLTYRLGRAITDYQVAKEAESRRAREEQARLAREEEDRRRAETLAAEAERQRLAQAARDAELNASRKRNEDTRKLAEEEAAKRRVELAAAEEAASARRAEEDKAANERAKLEKAAAVPAADLTRIRGQASVSSLKEFVAARDINRDKIDLEALRPYLTTADIEKAVGGFIRANTASIKDEIKNARQPVRGVVFYIDHASNVR